MQTDEPLSVEDEHRPLLQSLSSAHVAPSAHAGQQQPPQSTSVSLSSVTPFVHDAADGAGVVGSDEGTGVGMREGAADGATVGMGEGTGDGSAEGTGVGSGEGFGMQTGSPSSVEHRPLLQSSSSLHVLPSRHAGQLPPQSTSVSSSSRISFEQCTAVGAAVVGAGVGTGVGITVGCCGRGEMGCGWGEEG